MTKAQLPMINNSLRSFTRFIQTVMILGPVGIVVGTVWLISATSAYNIASMSLALGLIYIGGGLLSLGIIGLFLRQTASVIVDGLGGTLRITDSQPLSPTRDSDSSKSPERLLGGSLTAREYGAWLEAGEPDLSDYDKAKHPDFVDWLSNQKTN